jgi:hypothetical protein
MASLKLVAATAVVVAMAASAPPALAHARLEGSVPARGAILRSRPRIAFRFDEAVAAAPGRADARGRRLDTGVTVHPGGIAPGHAPAFRASRRQLRRDISRGSDDGHLIAGGVVLDRRRAPHRPEPRDPDRPGGLGAGDSLRPDAGQGARLPGRRPGARGPILPAAERARAGGEPWARRVALAPASCAIVLGVVLGALSADARLVEAATAGGRRSALGGPRCPTRSTPVSAWRRGAPGRSARAGGASGGGARRAARPAHAGPAAGAGGDPRDALVPPVATAPAGHRARLGAALGRSSSRRAGGHARTQAPAGCSFPPTSCTSSRAWVVGSWRSPRALPHGGLLAATTPELVAAVVRLLAAGARRRPRRLTGTAQALAEVGRADALVTTAYGAPCSSRPPCSGLSAPGRQPFGAACAFRVAEVALVVIARSRAR